MNKKAQQLSYYALTILRFVWLIVLVVIILFLIAGFSRKEIDHYDTEAHLIYYSLLHSKTGISYFDPDTERVYPGIVPYSIFKDKLIDYNLERNFKYSKEKMAFKITLSYNNEKRDIIVGKCYNLWDGILTATGSRKSKGVGGAIRNTFSRPILFRINDKLERGNMELDIILSNEPKDTC